MKITIVGGGTAGWLAALMIKKVQPNHEIVVIESSKIPIVGAGEGSTVLLTEIIQNKSWDYGCNELEFMMETDATIKLGIKHQDWVKRGTTYYGPIDNTSTGGTNFDTMLLHALANDIPFHTASRNGFLLDRGRGSIDGESHSYHFDAHKVGKYFKKVSQVPTIDAEVIDVLQDDHGITGLVLSNGTTLVSDFYIDCTGFRRLLMKSLGVKWHSYSKNLPVNSAMPFLVPYKDGEVIEPVTTAWAQSAGWMWKIPVKGRYGCGYVFDDNVISADQAQAEIETTLGHAIDPIRVLEFDTGRLNKVWHKNCLALGLASAFAEPLEATSIHTTIAQLKSFIFHYLQDTKDKTVTKGSQNMYNAKMCMMYDDFKDFLVLHYQTSRGGSPFWDLMKTGRTRTDQVSNILDIAKSRITNPADFNSYYGHAGASLWNWVLAGLGYINKDTATAELAMWKANLVSNKLAFKWHEHEMNKQAQSMMSNTDFIKQFATV